jgi:hypothetical protein
LGREEFGDGGDWAEVFIEDEFFDQGVGRAIFRGGTGVPAGGGAGVAADVAAVRGGVSGVASGCGAGIAREVSAGDEEAVQEAAGALVVELVAGDAVENLSEGELDAGAVVDCGQLEGGVFGVDSVVARGGAARGVVVVAEGLAAQGGGAAAAARGEDMTAEEALDGGLGWFGGCGRFGWVGHAGSPFVCCVRKNIKSSKKAC